jgi:dihydroorotase
MSQIATIIRNATIINEGVSFQSDLLIENNVISKIAPNISVPYATNEINAEGKILIPGVIDDQVHFREPGLTYKADIYSESRAALIGGVTSFMEMPNVNPQTTTIELLEEKMAIAAKNSAVNYSFFLGATNQNIEELKKINTEDTCGVKIFMGSSTGDMLVDDGGTLNQIFKNVPALIATHCECETRVKERLEQAKADFPSGIPASHHPVIRDEIACYLSSSLAVDLARKYGTRLHILHITSASETSLFQNNVPLEQKLITSEVCVHHLHFTDNDYQTLKHQIKCNPSIKSQKDNDALWAALLDDRLDIIATDHAPHTMAEKLDMDYLKCHAGLPLVQHSLLLMLQKVQEGRLSIEKMVEKMCHAPAVCFRMINRGFIREGYFADLVLIDPTKTTSVTPDNIAYKCGWSPLDGSTFNNAIDKVWVNGTLSLDNGNIQELNPMRLKFKAL